MSGQRADARKRQEAMFGEPQWQADPVACCETHMRVLTALRKVFPTADLLDAEALADALEDERDALWLSTLAKKGVPSNGKDVTEFLREITDRLRAIHYPTPEEAEWWIDDENPAEHNRRFPQCEALTSGNDRACTGHTGTILVCRECGYEHDGDGAFFRSWPCPTAKLADEYAPHFGRSTLRSDGAES